MGTMIVVSTGCPASIGPEVSVRAAAHLSGTPRILVGDEGTLLAAADLCGIPRGDLARYEPGAALRANATYVFPAGPVLSAEDRVPGKPTHRSGLAQLAYIEAAYALCRKLGAPLVTAPVSKAVIAASGEARAARFRGHTEWLQELDGGPDVTMCFHAPSFSSALVTTHLALRDVATALNPTNIARSVCHLAQLLVGAGQLAPKIAVASLNPHAGESELLGNEERTAIAPGIEAARETLRDYATITGPIGAETAFRLAQNGEFHGVVAMYHDQATIPMKLTAFGDAVNVTMGLSIVRTSVDHGTAYDIAWQGVADSDAMLTAMRLAERMR